MTDLSQTIIAKSDQLNADDLIGRSITIEITNVIGKAGDQPIAIHFKGDGGKPWLPCKGMRRVLVFIWGSDGKAYVGRWLTLFREPTVKFGGIEVGGIRISHMSHIKERVSLALTASKGSKKAYVVEPLAIPSQQEPEQIDVELLKQEARAIAYNGTEKFKEYWASLGGAKQKLLADVKEDYKSIAAECDAASTGGEAA